MKNRCAFLPSIGDPILSLLWIRQYKKNFRDFLNTLYVIINSGLEQEVKEFTKRRFEDSEAKVISIEPDTITHGGALKELFNNSYEELILLIEDDCFVLSSTAVDRCFRYIETGEFDLVGSPRHSCAVEISEAAQGRNTCPVDLPDTILENVLYHIKIDFHKQSGIYRTIKRFLCALYKLIERLI